jgi:Zn-finger protein
MKFEQVYDGEWVQPKRRGYMMQCCDCGLVHKLNFRLAKSKDGKRNWIQFQAFRVEAQK